MSVENRFVDKLRGLSKLSPEGIVTLERATSRPRKIAARRDLIREGDQPGPVFVVLQGWACRYKIMPNGARQILAFLMPGDCCDLHVGFLEQMDHSIQTVTSALVATIERDRMDAMLDEHPGIAKAMYIAQLIDEGTMRAWIASMGRRTSMERLAHLMCELHLRACNIGLSREESLSLPLSQLLLADALGMTPVHLNRVLRELRMTGAMTLQLGSLTITDPVLLAKIAGFDENYLHRQQHQVALVRSPVPAVF